MKKSLIVCGLISCMMLTGCGGKEKAKSGEEVQKIIEKAGWEVKSNGGGTVSESVDLVIDKQTSFQVSHDKEKNTISSVWFTSIEDETNYSVNRDADSEDDLGMVIDGEQTSCMRYNITKDKADTSSTNALGGCSTTKAAALKDAVEKRDDYLEKQGITLDDLIAWGKWHYKIEK